MVFGLALLLAAISARAADILGGGETEVAAWAQEKGYQVQPAAQGTTACLKGHRFIPMTSKGLKVQAAYFHPVYQLDTKVIAMVEFEPAAPISKAEAERLVIQVAPIAGTRPPTHRQAIPAGNEPCAPPNGGLDGRYTDDYFAEYFYAADRKSIERVRVYNENIR